MSNEEIKSIEYYELHNTISTLALENTKLKEILREKEEWGQIISDLLLHRETQVQNIIAALGKDIIPEYEGKTKFRKVMNNVSYGETDG